MANIYVRSTDGNDGDSGATWALAKATLAGANAIAAAGDTIWLSQVHSESTAGAISITIVGTLASPLRILCGNDSAEPPTALATTAIIQTTGANGINLAGLAAYWYGVNLKVGSGASGGTLAVNTGRMIFDSCTFQQTNTSTSRIIALSGGTGAFSLLRNCSVGFGDVTHRLSSNTSVIWQGGGMVVGSSTPDNLWISLGSASVLMEGCDLSGFASTMNIFTGGTGGGPIVNARTIVRNCKLPASWSGSIYGGTLGSANQFEMHNCDDGATNYRLWLEEYSGNVKQETTLIRTGGASNGVTGLSWKAVTAANAKYPILPLVSGEIVAWNNVVGSSVTVTVEILHDSATALKDDEVWLEVEYLGSSATPLSSFGNDCKADVLATAANQASSSATWTTTGMGNPNPQKLEVTFTPQMKGFIHAVVKVAKASYTLYVDPLITIA